MSGLSGKRDKVVVSCVTFEVSKIVEPVLFYEAARVHLIHYVKDNDARYSVYGEFYDEVCRQLRERKSDIEIIEHMEKVYDYNLMLRTVMDILISEKGEDRLTDVYVNVSAGTSEYSAAAMYASMTVGGTVPFTVGTKEYTTAPEDIRRMYYSEGRPVGLSRAVLDPRMIDTFGIDAPDEELVCCLAEIDYVNINKMSASNPSMIERLKSKDLWSYDMKPERGRSTISQKETMYYKRHYLEPMMAEGWIEKDPSRNRYNLTREGRSVLEVFYFVK